LKNEKYEKYTNLRSLAIKGYGDAKYFDWNEKLPFDKNDLKSLFGKQFNRR